MTYQYGTAEFYEEQFSDCLADVDAKDPERTKHIVEGFYRAIDSWFEYHDEQARAYAELRKRVRAALAV